MDFLFLLHFGGVERLTRGAVFPQALGAHLKARVAAPGIGVTALGPRVGHTLRKSFGTHSFLDQLWQLLGSRTQWDTSLFSCFRSFHKVESISFFPALLGVVFHTWFTLSPCACPGPVSAASEALGTV